jgi:hypothetical protein
MTVHFHEERLEGANASQNKVTLREELSFYGHVSYASEITIYRIFCTETQFVFLRVGSFADNNMPLISRLFQLLITVIVDMIIHNGPARISEKQKQDMTKEPLDKLLKDNRRNFTAKYADISNVSIYLPPLQRRFSKSIKPKFIYWKMHIRNRGTLKVRVLDDNTNVAIPIITGLFKEDVLGEWKWDKNLQLLKRF